MHSSEALILRRCFPVPVTLDELKQAYDSPEYCKTMTEDVWHATFKQITSAIDEVYAVIDGREVRVAIVRGPTTWTRDVNDHDCQHDDRVYDLLDAADREGYWARPHEVRITLQERPVSHDEVARAVLAGQEYAERTGGAR